MTPEEAFEKLKAKYGLPDPETRAYLEELFQRADASGTPMKGFRGIRKLPEAD